MMFIQRRLNVDATSWRCIDVEATLYKRHVPAGYCTDKKVWRLFKRQRQQVPHQKQYDPLPSGGGWGDIIKLETVL